MMSLELSFGDFAVVFATLLGPVLAVQAQKWVEARREPTRRRTAVFHTLMATRAAKLSIAHVEALNAVPVEFYGRSEDLRQVVTIWKRYIDHLNQPITNHEIWGAKRADLFIDLMERMSKYLGYDFSKVELEREVYAPQGHYLIELDQDAIRIGLAKLLKGETTLPLDIKSVPVDSTVMANQIALQDELIKWLRGERSVRVDIARDD